MKKATMNKLLLSNIHIVILVALLLLTRGKSSVEPSSTSAHPNDTVTSCIIGERAALLGFKAGLSDPANLLSSWKGDDCCKWKGVHCSSRNNHVIKLDLPGDQCYFIRSGTQVLGGKISSSLLGLQHLRYLNLSCNWFGGVQIPEFLGSLHELRYMDLSWSGFTGRIPPQLGNLSNLQYLNLVTSTYSMDITWLSQLTSLEHMDLSGVNLSTIVHWLPAVSMLPSLKVLHLSDCNLRNSSGSLQLSNLTSLQQLDLSANSFNTRITSKWFWRLTNLKYLDIAENGFYGPFTDEIGNMTSIVMLDVSWNYLEGMIPSNLNNLCSLEEFIVGDNNINGSIKEFFIRLPSCSWNKLAYLFVPSSNLGGSLPTNLEPLSNLTSLVLSSNQLTGHVPLWIGELTKLTELVLSYNNLEGFIHESHLSGLESLDSLQLSDNSIALVVNSTWVPPSNLRHIGLQSCLLGPKFPLWLRWLTRLDNLDISNTSISDTVPDWFWIIASKVETLNMRHNKISGSLPSTMQFMGASVIYLSSNKFSGPIPKLPISLTDLDLSKNNLVGPLPLDFGAPGLETLILFDNSISGTIPSSLCKLQSLVLLDISENKLTGPIPDCSANTSTINMTSMNIVNLNLRNNNLSGEFPSFLQDCPQLVFLDLAHNHFSGTLPTWIREKLPHLAFLRLRSNMFSGHIPEEFTDLVNLQFLDLAYNNITGSIPRSIVNYKMMMTKHDIDRAIFGALYYGRSIDFTVLDTYTENVTVVTKGQEILYTGEIIYMVNLDLSCNNLIGEIPEEIGTLVKLKNLNLSWNTFSGKIPENIGTLAQVESLDLSHNKLSGQIPASLSALTSLSRLNLSYNNLTGEVPSGNQLQTLEDPENIYIGNPGLCGPPVSQNCSQPEPIPAAREDHEDLSDVISFFIAMGSGYTIGLWVVFCTFLFKRKWRANWYSVCDRLYDLVYVQVAVTWASWITEKCTDADNDG